MKGAACSNASSPTEEHQGQDQDQEREACSDEGPSLSEVIERSMQEESNAESMPEDELEYLYSKWVQPLLSARDADVVGVGHLPTVHEDDEDADADAADADG